MRDILKGTNLSISNILDVDNSSNIPNSNDVIPSAESTRELLLSMEADKEKKNKDLINGLKNFSKKVGNNPEDKNDNMDIDEPGSKQSLDKNATGHETQSEQPENAKNAKDATTGEQDPNQQESQSGNVDPNAVDDPNAQQDGEEPQDGEQVDGNPEEQQEEENPIAMSDDSIVNIELTKISNILDKELTELKDAVKIVKGMKSNIESNITVNAEQVSQAQAECETFRAYFGLPNFFDNVYLVTEDDINDTPLLTYRLVYKQFLNSIRIVLSDYMDSK